MIAYVFPGQGSQFKGMGKTLFDEYRTLSDLADEVLGYSIRELCVQDPSQQLNHTQYTQAAIYAVSALSYVDGFEQDAQKADFFAGHSLGEYSALFAAGVFDFATGLRLVKKRGELMAQASQGGMAAVIGLDAPQIAHILLEHGFSNIDVANFNSPSQTVLSGDSAELKVAAAVFAKHQAKFIPLSVSAAFHSRYMRQAQHEFASYLQQVPLRAPRKPVIANVTALPHQPDALRQLLAEQITAPVRWLHSVEYLLAQGVREFKELGPGAVLTKLVDVIKTSHAAVAKV